MKPKNPAAVALGRLGGLAGGVVKSRRKARASRANGKLGGRPKKPVDPQATTGANAQNLAASAAVTSPR